MWTLVFPRLYPGIGIEFSQGMHFLERCRPSRASLANIILAFCAAPPLPHLSGPNRQEANRQKHKLSTLVGIHEIAVCRDNLDEEWKFVQEVRRVGSIRWSV
jgi:hypothetical protein